MIIKSKRFLGFLGLVFFLISIPLTVYLVQRQQIFKGKAVETKTQTGLGIDTTNSPYGVHGGVDIATTTSAKEEIARKLSAAGVKWTRPVASGWAGVEPQQGQWNWQARDTNYQISQNYGLGILSIFYGIPRWASVCDEVGGDDGLLPQVIDDCSTKANRWRPKNIADWENYVRQMVRRYGSKGKNQVKYWEIWNEPDARGFFRVKPGENRADEYFKLLQAVYRIIKEEDPSAKVLFGGISNQGLLNTTVPDQFKQFTEAVLAKPGIGNYFDIFNIHIYGTLATGEEPPNQPVYSINIAKQLLRDRNLQKPIWVTETNPGPPGNLAEQANRMPSWYSELLAAGAQKIFWFYLPNWCPETNCNPDTNARYWGLLKKSDFSIQPEIYNAYKQMAAAGSTYTWEYNGQNYNLKYKFTPLTSEATATGTLTNLEVTYNNNYTFKPSVKSGPCVIFTGTECLLPESSAIQRTISSVSFANNVLTVDYVFSKDNQQILFQYKFSLQGNTLKIEASSGSNKIKDFNLRQPAGTPTDSDKILYQIPYLTGGVARILLHNNIFTSIYFDWTKTGSSNFKPVAGFSQKAEYEQKTNGQRNLLTETVYLKVSPKIEEVFPDIPNQKSPFMDLLKDRVVLEIWGNPTASFSATERRITGYKDRGITNLLFLNQVWQRFSEGQGQPNTIPANESKGGDAGLKSLGEKARDWGYLFGVYENYIACDDPAETATPSLCIPDNDFLKNSDGQFVRWGGPYTWGRHFMMKPSRMLYWAGEYQRDGPPGEEVNGGYSGEIHRKYNTTAGWQDVAPGSPPWLRNSEDGTRLMVDFDANSPEAGKSRYTFDQRKALFALERSIHGGPILGEGGNHWLYAGLLDGVEAQIGGFHRNRPNPTPIEATSAAGENAPLLVDFDLRKIHPLMVQFGVGYEARFFGFEESDCPTPVPIPPDYDWSCVQRRIYRQTATEIAFGHAGYLHTNSQGLSLDPTLDQEFNYWRLIYPLQQKYLLNQPTSILYDIDGQMVDASTAIRRRADRLNNSHPVLTIADINRVKITYDNGLVVYVNRDPTDSSWNVNLPAGYKWLDYSAQKAGSGIRTDFVGYGTDTGFTIPKDGWVAYQPAVEPSPTPTPTPALANLTFNVAFQGITGITNRSQPPTRNAQVTLKPTAGGQQIGPLNITLSSVSPNWVYTGRLTNIPRGTYDLYLKGWAHLQKKFTNVTLNPGDNNQDFSGVILKTGDAVDNNSVDIYDYNKVVEHFGPRIPPQGSIADFDLDGDVDIFDYNYLVGNFGQVGE